MEFQIKDFVSTERKVDLVGLTIEECFIDGIVNPMVLRYIFDVNCILVYTDLQIEQSKKADKLALYDEFKKKGVLESFKKKMELKYSGELIALWDSTLKWKKDYTEHKNSIYGIIDNIKNFVEIFMEKTDIKMEDLKNLQLGELGQIIPLAKELGIDLENK